MCLLRFPMCIISLLLLALSLSLSLARLRATPRPLTNRAEACPLLYIICRPGPPYSFIQQRASGMVVPVPPPGDELALPLPPPDTLHSPRCWDWLGPSDRVCSSTAHPPCSTGSLLLALKLNHRMCSSMYWLLNGLFVRVSRSVKFQVRDRACCGVSNHDGLRYVPSKMLIVP